ncbi:MAG: cupredoxin domain-containing protein [Deltaproteobacteria bacterium]|nr:cupredoxin domain-containing protein [Deltaproteobacteria bacterium]
MRMDRERNRFFYLLAFAAAGFCLFRASSSFAASEDVEEVYSSQHADVDAADDETSDEYGRIDVRLSRPDEAESRLDPGGYAQVPGVERLMAGKEEPKEESLIIPVKRGPDEGNRAHRGIASVTPAAESARPESPVRETPRGPEDRAKKMPASEAYALVTDEPKPVKPGVFQEVSVIVSDHGYFPSRIFVTQNIPVRVYLTTPSKSTLCFMIDNWSVKKGITPGKVEEVNFVPDRAGNYRFYCPVKGIEGTLTVREAPAPGGEPARNVAALAEKPVDPQRVSSSRTYNEPKNAKQLRMLTDDE